MEHRQLPFAVAAAVQLNVLTSEEFDERIAAALAALASLPLNPQGLPAAYYHADTLETTGKPDASAIGMGRLLNALQTLLWRYPQHAGAVRNLLDRWKMGALIANNTTSGPRSRSTIGRWRRTSRETASAIVFMQAIRFG